MKRDWDLIRKLLIDIEEGNDFLADDPVEPKWTDQTEQEFGRQMATYKKERERLFGHLELLLENGYTDGYQVIRGADGYLSYGLSAPRLTMAGHDLLDTMRSSKVWSWVKATASTKGVELSFDAVKTLSAMALKAVLGG